MLVHFTFSGGFCADDPVVGTLLEIGDELPGLSSSAIRSFRTFPRRLQAAPMGTIRQLADELEEAFDSAVSLGHLRIEPMAHALSTSVELDSAPATERRPPTALVEEPRTWFEVKVIDAYGKPVDGAELLFSHGAQRERLKTNGSGIARWRDVESGSSFASATLVSLDDLREALKSRWGKDTPADLLDGPSVAKLSILDDELSAALESETPKTIVLYRPLTRMRLVGMHFDANKCFLRESAMRGIRQVVSVYQAQPAGKLLIVGHTDTTADESYNLDLSVERAAALRAYLKDDVASWAAWFGDDKPERKRWGMNEISGMLNALPCEHSISSFQQWSNESRGTDLEVDDIAGPKTRMALIGAYMALDGTTLPQGIEAVVHGCGEYFPRDDEADGYGNDDINAQENRRVEIFCFNDEIQPPVPSEKASKGEPEYEQWKNQVTTEIDLQAGVVTLAALDDLTAASMANVSMKVRHPDGNVRIYVTNELGEAFVTANAGDALTILEIAHETHSSLTRVDLES